MDIFEACRRGNIDRVVTLLHDGIDINAVDTYGDTPIIHAVRHGYMDIVTLLVDRGADMGKGFGSQSPLHVAIHWDNTEMVNYLLAAGADVNCATTNSCYTPLHYACRYASIEIIAALLAAGANVNAKDSDGETPAYWIVDDFSTWDMKMTLLLNAGADINAVDVNGNTITCRMIRRNDIDPVRFLLKHGARIDIQNAQGQTALDRTQDADMIALLESYDAINDVKNAARRK